MSTCAVCSWTCQGGAAAFVCASKWGVVYVLWRKLDMTVSFACGFMRLRRGMCALGCMYVCGLVRTVSSMIQNKFRQALWKGALKCLHDSGNFLQNTIAGLEQRLRD